MCISHIFLANGITIWKRIKKFIVEELFISHLFDTYKVCFYKKVIDTYTFEMIETLICPVNYCCIVFLFVPINNKSKLTFFLL